jgi:hypothetical protein
MSECHCDVLIPFHERIHKAFFSRYPVDTPEKEQAILDECWEALKLNKEGNYE